MKTTIILSTRTLKAIDKLARTCSKSRQALVDDILWSYVREQKCQFQEK